MPCTKACSVSLRGVPPTVSLFISRLMLPCSTTRVCAAAAFPLRVTVTVASHGVLHVPLNENRPALTVVLSTALPPSIR